MATWDDVGKLSWDQLGEFTWDEVARLTTEQVERFANELWPLVASLDHSGRAALKAGLLDGSLPPALLAAGDVEYTPAEAAALSAWTRFAPKDSGDLAAWVAVLLALLTLLSGLGDDEPPSTPPPSSVIIVEIPEPIRPLQPGEPRAPETDQHGKNSPRE